MPAVANALTDPRFRRALTQMVRRRVPESDAEDIVQAAFAEALASANSPTEMDALRRFVWGIARHKVADFYRRARREKLDVPEMEGPGAPHNEHDLLRWAARELPEGKDAEQTLAWMLREGDGEKLEAIAEAENVPAPRVRQRVSRLRKHLRERWAIEIAALAAIGVVVALVVWEMSRQPGKPITHDAPGLHEEPKDKAQTPPKSLPGTTDVPNNPSLTPQQAPPVPTSSASPSSSLSAPPAWADPTGATPAIPMPSGSSRVTPTAAPKSRAPITKPQGTKSSGLDSKSGTPFPSTGTGGSGP